MTGGVATVIPPFVWRDIDKMNSSRLTPMVGVGATEAVTLARWYVERTGLQDNSYAVIRQVKALIRKLGGNADVARQVMEYHLSSQWRLRNQKPVPFILAALPQYVEALGLDDYWIPGDAVEDVPPHLVVNVAHERIERPRQSK